MKTLMPIKCPSDASGLKPTRRLPNPRERRYGRCCTTMHPTLVGLGLVRLGDSDCVLANPEDYLCGKDVYDPHG